MPYRGDRAERLYRRLLGLLPADVRRDAEREMLAVFRAARLRSRGGGLGARVAFWPVVLADLVLAVAAERRPAFLAAGPSAAQPRRSVSMSVIRVLSRFLSDIPVALRRLRKAPGWTLGAGGTLALGLTASVVGVVLVRDVLLRPLPFPAADRLVRIIEVSDNGRGWWPSFPNAIDWRERGRMFDGVGIADIPHVTPVVVNGQAVRLPVSQAARGLFETLGVRPAAGRLFTDDENRPGGAPVAIVGERLWRHDLGGRPLQDLELTIRGERFAVVGVLPASFRFLGDGGAWTDPADIWTPMDRDTNLGSRTSHGYHVVGRLAPGMTIQRARAEMNDLVHALKVERAEPTDADRVVLQPLKDVAVRQASDRLRWLLYAAGAVLVVSCLNLAAGILAQGLDRGREFAVRMAIGATRGALVRHMLVEAAALAIPGAVVAAGLTAGALQIIRGVGSGALPRLDEIRFDVEAMALVAALAFLTAGIAAVIPAIALSRTVVSDRLRTRGASGARQHRRLWTGFVVVQIALALVLLAGTGLLLRSFTAALDVDLGYRPSRVLTVDVTLPQASYPEASRRMAFYDAALDRLRSAPGIERAGLTSVLPHTTSMYTANTARAEDRSRSVFAGFRLVDPGYFDVMGIRRIQGGARALAAGAVVDQRLDDQLWNGRSPVGDRVVNNFGATPFTVAGVVGTVREWNQGDETTGAVYVDFHAQPRDIQDMHFVVRYAGSIEAATDSVRHALAAVDPMVPATIASLESLTAEALGERRLQLVLASGFGLVALVLAAAGICAMVAFVVGREWREAAIRLALGARPGVLARRVLMRGLAPALAGVAAGAALAVPVGRGLAAQLFHVSPTDPVVLVTAAAAMCAAAIAASFWPARRVMRVDPVEALRQD